MENSNGQVQKIEIPAGVASSKLEHLRGILSKLQQTMEARRDERMGSQASTASSAEHCVSKANFNHLNQWQTSRNTKVIERL